MLFNEALCESVGWLVDKNSFQWDDAEYSGTAQQPPFKEREMIEQVIIGICFCIGFFCTGTTIVQAANSVVNNSYSDTTNAMWVASIAWGVIVALMSA